ncbi:DUF3040 domain-containing protein [Streptomyces sp. NPDC085460]|uniref:DUF3040 domain-containing protein n=1 Tax=Streptomyces sp. NPDC085460 TaxID=3365723 RepID=UPI0037D02332
MSHPGDDQRMLTEIERGLTRDDPDLATLMATLNQRFPEKPEAARHARSWKHDPRLVVVVVLTVIAVVALVVTAALGTSPGPPAGEDGRPAALSVATAPYSPW